jgi:hypothetical protein
LYDPALGRMLRPDNYVQSPCNTQNYNRYSYCMNNPTTFTDPTGNYYLIDDAIAAVVGGTINLLANDKKFHGSAWAQIKEGLGYFGAGAVGGVATLYLGPVAGFAIGGALNVGVDATNQNLTYGKLNSASWGGFAQMISQSFVTGGCSALSGGSAAYSYMSGLDPTDVGADAMTGNYGGFSSSGESVSLWGDYVNPSFNSFYTALNASNGLNMANFVYSGLQNVAWDYGRNNINFTNNSNLGKAVGDFIGGGITGIDIQMGQSNTQYFKSFYNSIISSGVSTYISNLFDNPSSMLNFSALLPMNNNNFGGNFSFFNNYDNISQSAPNLELGIFQLGNWNF